MFKVNLRSCEELRLDPNPEFLKELQRMRELATLDRSGRYELIDDPSAADLILFMECSGYEANCGPYLEGVRRDPVYRRYRSKSLVYSAFDFPIPFVPGIYPSIDRRWYWRSLARPGCYLVGSNVFIGAYAVQPPVEPRVLASFVGCISNQPVRRRLSEIRSDSILIVDNTDAFLAACRAGRQDELDRLKKGFVETVSRSKFVLCPRGYGASSIRLFEAMEMGRAPVILSDEWVPPEGPDWDAFSIRVAERDVLRVPEILRGSEAASEDLGKAARLAWEEWFSPDQLFRRMCETCEEMLTSRRPFALSARWLCYLHFARPLHARKLLSRIKNGRG